LAVADVTTAEQRWEKVVGDFRQLCMLRRQKKWIESDMILNSDLPRSIASWSEVFEGQPAAKKSRLDTMFQAEQRRIDDAYLTVDLVSARLKEEILPSIREQIIEEVRSSVLEELRAAIAEEVRCAVAAEMRDVRPTAAPEPARAIRRETDGNSLSDFAEQVRSTVAQQACAAVLEELARERKPAAPPRVSVQPRPSRPRVRFDDVPGVIDHVLAEEQPRLKKYKFEMSACP
jgi:hypothetical protein